MLGGGTSVWINICRGVKQGCPLSPLLFALAYDPLICLLDRIRDLDPFAFADDMALGTTRFDSLSEAMLLVNEFRAVSGLGVNVGKTTLIFSRGSTREVKLLVGGTPWPTLRVLDSHTYLGILMGRNITVEKIYATALHKLQLRMSGLLPSVRSLHHASRVTVFNVFLLTKLSYIMNYYSLPYDTTASSAVGVVERVATKLVINFNCAYPYVHLIQPPDRLGPSPPLRDAWIVSIATLAAQAELGEWDGVMEVTPVRGSHNSLRISQHIRASAVDFISWHLEGCRLLGEEVVFRAKDFIGKDQRSTRQRITRRLQRVAYLPEQDQSTMTVLSRRGLLPVQETVDAIHSHYAAASNSLPPRYRKTTFHLIFNALATSRRCLVLTIPDSETRRAQPPTPCFLCQEGSDDANHLYGGDCPVVYDARALFSAKTGIDLAPETLLVSCPYRSASRTTAEPVAIEPTGPELPFLDCGCPGCNAAVGALPPPSPGKEGVTDRQRLAFKIISYLAFPSPSTEVSTAALIFNGTVWSQRGSFFKTVGPGDSLSLASAARRVAEAAAMALEDHLFPRPKTFGRAGERTPQQQAAAHAHAMKIIAGLPSGTVIAFTDGASRGNPGPTGAGCALTMQGEEGVLMERFVALGSSTNNTSELWAIGMALEMLRSLPHAGRPYSLHVLTDSTVSMGLLKGKSVSRIKSEIVLAIRDLRDSLKKEGILGSLHIDWIPGHAGVQGNEHTDFLANLGADRSAKGRGTIDLGACITRRVFAPD